MNNQQLVKFYRWPAFTNPTTNFKLKQIQLLTPEIRLLRLQTERCFYVASEQGANISEDDLRKLQWVLAVPFEEDSISCSSSFTGTINSSELLIEIGPRLNFSTPFSTNAVSVCHSIGISHITRIEVSTRYLLTFAADTRAQDGSKADLIKIYEQKIVDFLHDKMTQCRYSKTLDTFKHHIKPDPWFEVDVLTKGKTALSDVSRQLGLALDDWDINYYTRLFSEQLKRNPTSVECFDLAQSNSEHSRHWFFKGNLEVDGMPQSETLFELVMSTQNDSNNNNVIKFSDNSSAIHGFQVHNFIPTKTWKSSCFIKQPVLRHITLSAETHNFPTGVSPFSGAATGTGGRIRDTHAAGKGSHVIAATAGYCFGNLLLPDYPLPWEDTSFHYPSNFAHPRQVAIEASNGASDYGNKFGEPVVAGFTRSFGMRLPGGERREYVKPIMFSGGIGAIDDSQVKKMTAASGMAVVKLGGPVYRIGVGGGAASSVQVQGDNKDELDFVAVQRGDPEMEQKLNRVIRACVDMGQENPICSIHDQGAGGNGNVLKEIVDPAGAVIYTESFHLGDTTISTLELWGAEYQESDAILIQENNKMKLTEICQREKCPVSFVGNVTGDGKIRLVEGCQSKQMNSNRRCPVDLELDMVLGKMPSKEFKLTNISRCLKHLSLPDSINVTNALERVLRLPSVASKRFLTNKVDRCVSGLVAQQQCVGPLHTPLADVAVVALSFFDKGGGATAIGEQPIKGLLDPGVGARMSVAESITNLMFAPITSLQDVKCSANWMWPAKLAGEGAALHTACKAMTETMRTLGIAVDGGKDSLSMAARVGAETVKSPGTLVISSYAPCTDITAVVTPDLKRPQNTGVLLHVDLAPTKCRLGGTALAQCFQEIGSEPPDLDDARQLKVAFDVTQKLIKARKLSAGHDVSDGGLITCLLEMAFAGNRGLEVNITAKIGSPVEILFSEEVGWILEISENDTTSIMEEYRRRGIQCSVIGYTVDSGPGAEIFIRIHDQLVIYEKMAVLRDVWEATSFALERRQTSIGCVMQEEQGMAQRLAPPYKLCFDAELSPIFRVPKQLPRVAILREEGTNGDREMAAAFFLAGFEVWDITMTDFTSHQSMLEQFQGLVFPGGFSYADVLGSAKGWAAALLFNQGLRKELANFRLRKDTFSFGICNGCQLMALLGWIAPSQDEQAAAGAPVGVARQGVVLSPNMSERFECRFSTVCICDSPSFMMKGMIGSILGVWVAHGEGQFTFKNEILAASISNNHLIPMRYVDDHGHPTMQYPHNPNGSPGGIAALCSEDGRHLAIMPHPERCVQLWQWAWLPQSWTESMKTSPWLRMFRNAFAWCVDQPPE